MKRSDKHELEELQTLLAGEAAGANPHLDSELGALRYINDADQIKDSLPGGKILDWGCGLGQMTYLLKKRGFDVVSYDVDQGGREFLDRLGQTLIVATDPVKLPFADGAFDAVLSSGVLEHVADRDGSLAEIRRVTKPGGRFFIFRLPNKYSYIEFLSDRLGRGDHPVKFSRRQIIKILSEKGFQAENCRYQGFLPYNLKGFPAPVRSIYHRLDAVWRSLDPLLDNCPGLRVFCTNLELVARRK